MIHSIKIYDLINKKQHNYKFLGLVFIIEFIIFALQAPFDLDPHHDGLSYAMAIASKEGYLPNRDFFAQYGPLTPYIFGFVLKLFGTDLLFLRLFTSLLLALTGTVLFAILKRRLLNVTSLLITLAWAVTSPIYLNLNTNLPWATVITSLMLILSINFLQLLESQNIVSKKFKLITFALCFLLIFGFLGRQQLIFVFLFVPILLIWEPNSYRVKYFRKLVLIYSMAIACFLGFIFLSTGLLIPWLKECVLFALKYSLTMTWANPQDALKAKIVDLALYLLFPGYVFFYFLAIKFSNRIRSQWVYILITMTFFGAILAIQAITIAASDKSFLNPYYIAIYFSQNTFMISGYLSAGAIIGVLFRFFRRHTISIFEKLSIFIGITALLQLYPVHDPLHIWWLTPVMLSSIVAKLSKFEIFAKPYIRIRFEIFTFFTILTSFAILFNYLNFSRVEFKSPILQGIYAEASFVESVDATLFALNRLPINSKIAFDCQDALYSVYDGTFNPQSRNIVNWEPKIYEHEFNLKKYNYVFVCYINPNDLRIRNYNTNAKLVYQYDFNENSSNRIYKVN